APPPLDRREANNYAMQLIEVTKQVAEHYVRPVKQAELIKVALQGLYESAGVPVPPTLAAEMRRAAASEDQMLLLVRDIRWSLGNRDSPRTPRAIQASLRAMTRILDPYTVVLTGADAQRANSSTPNEFGLEWLDGSGAGSLVVRSVVLG